MKESLDISKDNLQDAAKSYNNCNEPNMKEILLIKCDTTIYADEITNLLIENNIVSRQHDEGQDQRPGAYGAITGIAIYVYEKDYEKAVEITNPIVNSRNKSHVWCPKCGSYNVSAIYVSNKYGTAISLLCIFLVLIPGLYIVWANDFGLRSTIADYIVLFMFIFFQYGLLLPCLQLQQLWGQMLQVKYCFHLIHCLEQDLPKQVLLQASFLLLSVQHVLQGHL